MEPRLFIAVPVGAQVRRLAAELSAQLAASGADYKWVEEQNLHITLRFLGATPESELARITEAMRWAAARPPFEIAFGGLGAFSSWQDPRVIWIGVVQGAAELSALAAALGPSQGGKPFSAHLTLGRMRSRRNINLLAGVAATAQFPQLSQRVAAIELIESRLTSQGSIYQVRREELLRAI